MPQQKTLEPHQLRVVAERQELTDRIDKLIAFTKTPIFDALDRAEQFRLVRQLDAMRAYEHILSERISAFGE